jgi:hypothetical protein
MFHDDSIAGSWQALVRRIEITDALGRWAVEDDRLVGLHEVARDLLPLLPGGADAAHADEILGALVGRAAIDGGGDDDALLLTLHLLSDWVWPLAVLLRDLGTGMVGVIVSELTCQIRTYPWRGRTRAVAASLRWDTRSAVLAEFRPSTPQHRHRAERVLDPMSPEWGATPLGRIATAAVDDGEDVDLVDLLLWAARAGVDETDIALLVRTEQARADSSVNASDDVVAAEFGLPRRTFFRHRARALDAVRAASRDYLAAVA